MRRRCRALAVCLVAFRVGAIYAVTELIPKAGAVDQASVEEIAVKQAACLTGAGPSGPIDAPAGIASNNQPASQPKRAPQPVPLP
jgi:hypothetical protein